MKIFLRSLMVLLAPPLTFGITLLASSLFLVFIYYNSTIDEVNAAVQQHFVDHENVPITIFHDNIYLATKDIAKGQKISSDMLERETYIGQDEDSAKAVRVNKALVGATAQDAIAKGELIFATNLTNFADLSTEPDLVDKQVKDSPDNDMMFYVLLAVWGISGIGSALTILGSQIWIIVLAFRKGILWGITCLLLPLAVSIFEIRNWEQTKKIFKIQIIGFVLLGVLAGTLIGVKVKTDVLEGELAKTVTALYVEKNVPEGSVISESDFTEILMAKSKIPEDALRDKSEAIGHKSRFALSKGNMLRSQDISE